MEGGIFEQGFEETFESEFGALCVQWVRMTKAAFVEEAIVSRLYESIQVANVLSFYFDQSFGLMKVAFRGPGVFVLAINWRSISTEYEVIKGNIGVFGELGSSLP
jgi:hypothetical protein